ncbi:MAG TPA: SDR family oxidoreductase [Candidatus Hydrogenedentes bacterium]|nr:SDR family oxidoreductase [Candidatus Hydrogenedentota bacterium]HNT88069.1 SDR family oxidoreductase [Candidatus Hydrogenedentota bacterium]
MALLEDKTALITGAGRGIGRGIALAFAREGCRVALVARTLDELNETTQLAADLGGEAFPCVCDVAAPSQVDNAVNMVLHRFGHIDILVNNAGYACFKPFTEIAIDEWRHTLDVNLTGPFLVTQAVLPSMIARRSGRIINVSSVAGLKPIAEQSAYCASKFGLNGFSLALALELRAYDIAVHALCPGGVATRLADEAMPERDKADWMTPEDVAQAALYLATLSPRATTDVLHIRRFDSTPLGAS